MIGDPRPTSEREIISKETVLNNVESIKKQVEKIFDEQHHTLLRRGIIFQVNENKDFSICRILIAFLCLLRHKR